MRLCYHRLLWLGKQQTIGGVPPKRNLRHTRMGWKEPPQEQKFSGAIGTYDLSKLSDDELKRAYEILARAAISATAGVPGADSDA
jgi:hypothetical protein